MLSELSRILECFNYIDCTNKVDLTNTAATIIGIIIGSVIGAIISWWIYNRQEKTAVKEQEILDHIVNLEEKHENILEKHELVLEKIQIVEQNHEEMLNNILTLGKKIDSLLENR
jgi:Na+/glutamate symporter